MTRRDDFDDDDRPRRRKPSQAGLWIGLGVGAFVFLGLLAAGGLFVFLQVRDAARAKAVEQAELEGAAASGPVLPGSLAHWTFDTAPNKRVPDASGNGQFARLVVCNLGDGVHGQGVVLGGAAGEHLDLGMDPRLSFGADAAFTIALWVRTDEREGMVLSMRNSRSDRPQIDLAVRAGKPMLVVGDDTDPGQGHAVVWGGPVADGNWHHLAFTRAGNAVELFVDGVSQDKKTGAAVAGPITSDLRAIGLEKLWAETNDTRWGVGTFKGSVDDLHIYSRALTPAEVTRLAAR
jgi:hypothetical protein